MKFIACKWTYFILKRINEIYVLKDATLKTCQDWFAVKVVVLCFILDSKKHVWVLLLHLTMSLNYYCLWCFCGLSLWIEFLDLSFIMFFNNILLVLWCRKRLFNMINDLPTVFEVVTGTAKKQVKEKSSVSNHSSNKTKSNSKVSRTLMLQLYLVCYICTDRKS